MLPDQYIIDSSLSSKEAKERAHFLAYKKNILSEYDDVRPGNDKIAEPDIVVSKAGETSGFEVTELWLSEEQAWSHYTNKIFEVSGKSTFDLLDPLIVRLEDKFKPFRKDGKKKYSIPTILLVIDRTGIPVIINSDEFFKANKTAMKEQTIFPIDFLGTKGIFSRSCNGTPVNSVSVVQQLLKLTTSGSRIDKVFWFIPSNDIRITIGYPERSYASWSLQPSR